MISRSTDVRAALRSRQRGFLLNPYRFGAAADPYASNNVLLLHGVGTEGSTTILDSSQYARTPTLSGNFRIRTNAFQYGASSLYADGAGDYLTYANSSDFNFGSGGFTVEAFVRPATVLGYHTICGYANGSAANSNYSFALYQADAAWQFNIYSGSTSYGGVAVGTAAVDTWAHVAFSRVGNNLYTFVNGVLLRTTNVTGVTVNNPAGSVLQVGKLQGYYDWYGYMHLRIKKGVGLYSATFTPPTFFP